MYFQFFFSDSEKNKSFLRIAFKKWNLQKNRPSFQQIKLCVLYLLNNKPKKEGG